MGFFLGEVDLERVLTGTRAFLIVVFFFLEVLFLALLGFNICGILIF
jgi:hypothetical protein